MGYVTRFAPSPTGPLHLGHAFSALTAQGRATAQGGTFLLRIEDIDTARCKPEWTAQIFKDLHWLGLRWPGPVLQQSARLPAYRAAIARLAGLGVLYPCRCTRADVRAALGAPQPGDEVAGMQGAVYPGTCRGRSMHEATPQDAIRLDMRRALTLAGPVSFDENGPLHTGRHHVCAELMADTIGDVVIARRDIATSYHLAVVVDDGAQMVTEVVRGDDLFGVTGVQALLHTLLQQNTPEYYHHRIITDNEGRRLAKRDDAKAIALLRHDGATPADIRHLVGL